MWRQESRTPSLIGAWRGRVIPSTVQSLEADSASASHVIPISVLRVLKQDRFEPARIGRARCGSSWRDEFSSGQGSKHCDVRCHKLQIALRK